jgi:hypothetical protein
MSVHPVSGGRTAQIAAGEEGPAATSATKSRVAAGPPSLGDVESFEGLGVEALAAALVSESAQSTQKVARECEKDQKQEQIDALRAQVEHLYEKADDLRGEGLVGGIGTIAGGAIVFGAGCASVGSSGQPETDASATSSRCAPDPQVRPDVGASSAPAGASVDVRGTTPATISAGVPAAAWQGVGSTIVQASPLLAKATYGAAQAKDDARATLSAAAAKFAESARDEYANIARDAKSTIDKAQQALQDFIQERNAAMRAILRA